jgi:hypothetical protein
VALDSNKLGGVLASEYVTNTTVGSSFIRNAATLQTGNFNISGNGFVGGNFGIGTTAPATKFQVDAAGYGITQTSGGVTVGSFITTFNGGSGWYGTRSNHPLNFFTNDSQAQMTLTPTGNFGIGITNPTAKLQVFNSDPAAAGIFSESAGSRAIWGKSTTNSGVFGQSSVSSLTAAGVYGLGTSGGSIGVIGEANFGNAVGVFGVSASAAGVGVYARNNFGGRAIYAEGNISQNLADNGVVKAMIFVNANGTIARCYNSQTNSSSGPCGFTVANPSSGTYDINFGFQVDNRFILTTTLNNLSGGGCFGGFATIEAPVGNTVRVLTACSNLFPKPFMLFVY